MRLRLCGIALCGLLAGAAMPAAAVGPTDCPQPRFTGRAPDDYLQRTNPLPPDADLKPAEARYLGTKSGVSCATCHGAKGDGKGPLSNQFDPPPRNFSCARTVRDVPDGQLFWIIRHGSGDTAMPAHPQYTDREIWELVAHLRKLAR